MIAYKEWGYQLYPGVAFEDLASRTEKLGGKARTRDLMLELRDTERDRVIEAKYGRSAVDDVHAQEAAKRVDKEAAETEEREVEDPAKTRYMDVDEEGPPGSSTGEDGGGEGKKRSAEPSSAAMSEQVRERMEVNRRLALERLRSKKAEAGAATAAAAAATAEKDPNRNTADVAGTPEDDAVLMEAMDVDADREGTGVDFEDDEAALAEMEAEEMAGKTRSAKVASVPEAGATLPLSNAAKPAVVNASSTAEDAPATDTVGTDADDKAGGETLAESTERREKTKLVEDARRNAASTDGDDVAPTAVVGSATAGGLPDAPVLSAEHTSDTTAVSSSALGLAADVNTSKSSPSAEGSLTGSTSREEACANRREDSTELALGAGAALEEAAAGDAPQTTAIGGGSCVEETSLSSPKTQRTARGVPFSPLESLFAGTDERAEGQSVAARATLGGLFSD